jgi:hypothetical protein
MNSCRIFSNYLYRMEAESHKKSIFNYATITRFFPTIGNTANSFIEAHSKIYGYPIFEITCLSSEKQYAIIRADWNVFFRCKEYHSISAYCTDDTSVQTFIVLNEQNLVSMKEIIPLFFETYVAQRYFFPASQHIKNRPVKKVSFEVGFQLLVQLSDLLLFTHQKKIVTYEADFLLELTNNFNRTIPSIIVEIIETNDDCSLEHELSRESLIECYNNRLITIIVNTMANQKEIDEIISNYSIIIRELAKELAITHGKTCNKKEFIKKIQENNIEKELIKMFVSQSTGDVTFRYFINEVIEFLGCTSKEHYNYFKELLDTPAFEKNIDWKIGNDSHIIITQTCFIRLCILSRTPRSEQIAIMCSKVYETAFHYAERLRIKKEQLVTKQSELSFCKEKSVDIPISKDEYIAPIITLEKTNIKCITEETSLDLVTKKIEKEIVHYTQSELSTKTMNELKDICRYKKYSGFSTKKTKYELIQWMLTKSSVG